MKCGFAQAIMTPAPGDVYQDGYGFRIHPAEGVRDELYAKVCAIIDGAFRFAIVSLDVCGFSPEVVDHLRGHIAGLSGLPADHIAICATHTHAGPAGGILCDLPINGLVWARIGEIAGCTAKNALENAAEGHFSAAFGRDLTYLFNRRGRKPFDPRVRAAAFTDTQGRVRGILATAACHAVINTTYQLSADYPSVLTREATRVYGVPALFLQGADGDIDPHFDGKLSVDEKIELLGGEFAASVLDAVKTAAPLASSAPPRAAVVCATLPMRDTPDEQTLLARLDNLEAAYYAVDETIPGGAVDKRIRLRELLWTRDALARVRAGHVANTLTVPVMTLVAGGLAFIFSPFELLTLTGAALNEQFSALGIPDAARFVVSYANGTRGYLATAAELPLGGYEFDSAPLWYGMPLCTGETEGAYLEAAARAVAAVR